MPHVLDVIVFFKLVKQLIHLCNAVRIVDGGSGLRNIGNICGSKTIAHVIKRVAHCREIIGCGDYFGNSVFVFEIVAAGFHNVFHKLVFVKIFVLDYNNALAVEHERNAAVLAEVSAEFVEVMADIACGAVAVIGKSFNYNGNSAGAVAFVNDVFKGCFVAHTGGFFNGSVYVVVRHIVGFRLKDKSLQLAVVVGVRASFTDCYGDFTADFGEDLAAGSVYAFFFAFDGTPFGMS